jgi:hypothetical protein
VLSVTKKITSSVLQKNIQVLCVLISSKQHSKSGQSQEFCFIDQWHFQFCFLITLVAHFTCYDLISWLVVPLFNLTLLAIYISVLFNLTSLISIYSSLSSQHGGYYTSLLSQYDEDVLGDEDHIEVENEVTDVSPMTGMTSDSKIKGWSKNFSEQEDNLLVSAWLNVGQDPVDEKQQKMPLFGDELRSIIMSIEHLILTVIGPR